MIDKSKHYQRMFQGGGHWYILADIFINNYKSMDVLVTFIDNRYTTYLPKANEKKALDDGLKLFSSPKLFKAYADGYMKFRQLSDKFFQGLKKPISRSGLKKAMDIFIKNFYYYSRTEYFYLDKAFQNSTNNPTLKNNLKQMEKIKFDGRAFMNKIFLEKNGYLVKIKKILSAQFDIEGDAFQMYSVNEMLNLFDGFRLSDAEIKNRARAYLMMFNNNKIDYYEGETAEKMIKEFTDDQNLSKSELKGVIASKGKAVGKARIIEYNFNFEKSKKTIDAMKKDEILIAEVTSPEYMVACQKAAAIVTNQGGMLSHAAVVSREMDIPCVVGTGNATAVFKTGDMVEVDADNGVVRKI